MSWLQLKLATNAEQAERLSELLSELGAVSVTLADAADQPLFEPLPGETPFWQQTLVTGLFHAQTDTEQLIGRLQRQWGDEPLPPQRWEPLADQDWTRAWLAHFRPMRFGDHLWIIPSGYEPPEPQGTNIELDPGLAFGTGTHPTTAMCLTWLDRHPPIGRQVLDYGCGSGILSIAAVKLGAKSCLAADIDPQALLATRDNARKNGVDAIQTCLPHEAPAIKADLLLANILAGPLMELAPLFADRLKAGGEMVLAGLLAEQAEALIHHYQSWFELQLDQQVEEWVCLHGRRRATTNL